MAAEEFIAISNFEIKLSLSMIIIDKVVRNQSTSLNQLIIVGGPLSVTKFRNSVA